MNATTYQKGLGVHAASDVRFTLAANCSRFKASVGVGERSRTSGSVIFQVYAGTTKIYDSGTMTGTTATKLVDVSIAGASELRLVVTDARRRHLLRPRRLGACAHRVRLIEPRLLSRKPDFVGVPWPRSR